MFFCGGAARRFFQLSEAQQKQQPSPSVPLYSLNTFLALLLIKDSFLFQREEDRLFDLVFQVFAYSDLFGFFGQYDLRFHDHHLTNPMLNQKYLCCHHSFHVDIDHTIICCIYQLFNHPFIIIYIDMIKPSFSSS